MKKFQDGTIVIKPESRTKILGFDEIINKYIVCDVNNESDKWEVDYEYAHKNYKAAPTDFKERLTVEIEELRVKAKKLKKFIDTDEKYVMLTNEEKFLMNQQHQQMMDYHETLSARWSILHKRDLDKGGQI